MVQILLVLFRLHEFDFNKFVLGFILLFIWFDLVTLQIRYDLITLELFLLYHKRPLSKVGILMSTLSEIGKDDRGEAAHTLGIHARMFKP